MAERTINIKGLNISLREEGQGEPFLILHGWGSGKNAWIKVQNILSQNLRVISFDFPSFGSSESMKEPWNVDNFVEFVNDLLKELNINQPFYLAGHSFGGRVAIKFSIKYPQKIKELFLIDAAGIRHEKKPWRKRFDGINKKIAVAINTFSFFPGYGLLRKIVYRVIFRKSDYFDLTGVKKDTFLQVIEENLKDLLVHITVKTNIIWGEHDQITPLKDAKVINEGIKNSELRIIDTGHMPYRTNPELLAKTILEFIKT